MFNGVIDYHTCGVGLEFISMYWRNNKDNLDCIAEQRSFHKQWQILCENSVLALSKKLLKTSRTCLKVKKKTSPVFADPLRVQKHQVSSVVHDLVVASFVSEPRKSKITISYKRLSVDSQKSKCLFTLLIIKDIN